MRETLMPLKILHLGTGMLFGGVEALLVTQARHGSLDGQDHKSELQEYLQSRDEPLPEYRLAGASGPDHRKVFQVEVMVRGEAIAQGAGPSKKEAEQEAAKLTLEKLKA